MTTTVPTLEPTEVIVGDTWTWEKTLSDYPAPTWTLSYYLRSVAGEIAITAAADGTDHLVTVAKATTANYKAGRYGWTSVVTDGTSRFTLDRGEIVVLPDPSATGAGFDPRSHARKTLEAIEAVIEGRATKDQEEYTIGSRSLKRTPLKDLLALRSQYRAEVQAESAQNGQLSTGRINVRL